MIRGTLRTAYILVPSALFVAACSHQGATPTLLKGTRPPLAVTQDDKPASLKYNGKQNGVTEFDQFFNSDVRWERHPDGIVPFLAHSLENTVQSLPADWSTKGKVINSLLELLDDPDRYVMAHVVLSLYTEVQPSAKEYEWHCLKLGPDDTGRWIQTEDQRVILKRFWRQALTLKSI